MSLRHWYPDSGVDIHKCGMLEYPEYVEYRSPRQRMIKAVFNVRIDSIVPTFQAV